MPDQGSGSKKFEIWVRGEKLSSVTPRTIDTSQMKAATPKAISYWFDELQCVIDEHNILLSNIYNIGQSGFSIGKIEASRCIIDAHIW